MVNHFCGEDMKADSALIRAPRNNSGESSLEAEKGEQHLMDTSNVTLHEELGVERRKEAASQPLYLIRYE